MHEAGIAQAIVAELRTRQTAGVQVRILVRGGHADAAGFDAALRAHLRAAGPDLDLAGIEIVHLPAQRRCASCSAMYEAVDPAAPCPTCGGSAWPDTSPEQIEVEIPPGAPADQALVRRSAAGGDGAVGAGDGVGTQQQRPAEQRE